jgi:PBP1b-binding outer membrane lipoprotein LpoB
MNHNLSFRRTTSVRLAVSSLLLGAALGGCVTVPNSNGSPPRVVDPSVAGPVSGVGIESQDIVSMTDRMVRDMIGDPILAGRGTPPRIVVDSGYFRNSGMQAINRDLITNRLRVNLNRASQGRFMFVTRTNLEMVQQERDLKRTGVTDIGSTGLTRAIAGADYRLTGEISSLDQRNPKTGMVQRYNQITFEMVDLESGQIVWSGQYEFERAAADDVIYR